MCAACQCTSTCHELLTEKLLEHFLGIQEEEEKTPVKKLYRKALHAKRVN